MTEDEILDCRWQLLYRSDFSSRYHRKRATFLTNLDTLFTLITITAGASAFGDLVSGAPGWMAKIGAATVTLISIMQVILRLGPAGMMHTQWMKRWARMNTEIALRPKPTVSDIRRWTEERAALEDECVGELRALTLICEDEAARFLDIPGRQHKIWFAQRLLAHFGSFQQRYPYLPEGKPPTPTTPEQPRLSGTTAV